MVSPSEGLPLDTCKAHHMMRNLSTVLLLNTLDVNHLPNTKISDRSVIIIIPRHHV